MSDLKVIKIFSSRIEAEIAKGFLQSNDVSSIIISDDAGSMYPSQDMVSGVKLMVSAKDFHTAKEFLEALEFETVDDAEE